MLEKESLNKNILVLNNNLKFYDKIKSNNDTKYKIMINHYFITYNNFIIIIYGK